MLLPRTSHLPKYSRTVWKAQLPGSSKNNTGKWIMLKGQVVVLSTWFPNYFLSTLFCFPLLFPLLTLPTLIFLPHLHPTLFLKDSCPSHNSPWIINLILSSFFQNKAFSRLELTDSPPRLCKSEEENRKRKASN